jgi:DNA excision repair protein ERCC-2
VSCLTPWQTLEITDTDDFTPIHLVADFGTLVGTYAKGFAIIIEPFDERLPQLPDPVIQVVCSSGYMAHQGIVLNRVHRSSGCAH